MRRLSSVLCISIAISLTGSVAEAALCSPGSGNYFASATVAVAPFGGIGPPPTGVHKARATVRDRDMVICSQPLGGESDGTSSTWVMLAGGATPFEYAQIGYVRRPNWQTPRNFFQWNSGTCGPPQGDCGSFNFKTKYYTPSESWWDAGSTHVYRVEENDLGKVDVFADGNLMTTTPWYAQSVWGPHSGWLGQFAGEVFDLGDDIAGSPSAKTTFRDIRVGASAADSYHDVPAGSFIFGNDQPGVYYIDRPVVHLSCENCFNLYADRPGGHGGSAP